APLSVVAAGIQAGETDAALHQLKALRDSAPLDAPSSIANLGSWSALYALAGAGFDEPDGRLAFRPHPPSRADPLPVPLFGPGAGLWLDYRRSRSNANSSLRLNLVKRCDEQPFVLRSLVTDTPIETTPGALGVLVQSPRGIERGQTEVEGGQVTFTFKTP